MFVFTQPFFAEWPSAVGNHPVPKQGHCSGEPATYRFTARFSRDWPPYSGTRDQTVRCRRIEGGLL